MRDATGDLHTDKTYTGQRTYTDNFGLMYYNARWYDPTIGRFAQADSVADGFDRYAYVKNNPINYIDPDGHFPILGALLLTAAVLLLAGCSPSPNTDILQTAQNVTTSAKQSGEHWSMSTKINDTTALSHDHYPNYFAYGFTMDTMQVGGLPVNKYDGNGGDFSLGGTSLLTVDGELPGDSATLATQDEIANIQSGSMADVAYWDDSNKQISTTSLKILGISPSNGSIVLDNISGILNGGDSGAGIFYDGKLIGNLSGVNYAYRDNVLGPMFPWSAYGELLPDYIKQDSTANTPVNK